MGAEIVRRWNQTVREDDVIYVLGDIGRRDHFRTVHRLHGKKHLVAGNGDDIARIVNSGLFATISVVKSLPGVILTHIPVHPSQLRGRMINVHGHLHSQTVGDPRYRCVSVEQTQFAPVRLEDLRP
jgi:calcineurin-like phosphoesterase family protein